VCPQTLGRGSARRQTARVRTCPSCGAGSAADARFCSSCGAQLEKALTPHEERKLVSVLFVDLVGSTARADNADPEDFRDALQLYYAEAKRRIEQHGGVLQKFIGDAVSKTSSPHSRPSARPLSSEPSRSHTSSRGPEAASPAEPDVGVLDNERDRHFEMRGMRCLNGDLRLTSGPSAASRTDRCSRPRTRPSSTSQMHSRRSQFKPGP
jgi:hypothetical protein